ncbi:hypothetical protein HPB50_027850 [Hyalomma asiaticum]|nr:hypothetical protein HPB50_027850 [Hyalomma asiaticum]
MTCLYRSPPGYEIYHKGCLSIFEVDGRKDKWYAQNLCLLAKCFLENKALCYDIDCDIDSSLDPSYDLDPYLFYVLTANDRRGRHIVGYFSKEKFSVEDYNVACILVLPPYQRRGFGRLLVEFSYELSKHEGTVGTPEKPLSPQGLSLYQSYWCETILDALIKWWNTFEKKEEAQLSVGQISHVTSIKKEDVIDTMRHLGLFVCDEGEYGIPIPDNVMAIHRKAGAKERLRVDPKCIQWKPDEVARPCM